MVFFKFWYIVKMSEEEDYMSDAFLATLEDVRPGLKRVSYQDLEMLPKPILTNYSSKTCYTRFIFCRVMQRNENTNYWRRKLKNVKARSQSHPNWKWKNEKKDFKNLWIQPIKALLFLQRWDIKREIVLESLESLDAWNQFL